MVFFEQGSLALIHFQEQVSVLLWREPVALRGSGKGCSLQDFGCLWWTQVTSVAQDRPVAPPTQSVLIPPGQPRPLEG